MKDLGTIGGLSSNATGINDSGIVVGTSVASGGEVRAFRWTASGGMQSLPTLGGKNAYGLAINKFGDLSGASSLTVQGMVVQHAFLWTRRTGMQDLGALNGTTMCYGSGINSQQEVVGYCLNDSKDGSAAFVWTQANGMQDLNTLIPADYRMTMVSASGVNKYGQIAVTGVLKTAKNPSEGQRALLLSLK